LTWELLRIRKSRDRKDQLFAFLFPSEMRYQSVSLERGEAMSQPNKKQWRKLRSHGVRASDVDNLLSALRALDRIVVKISTRLYKIPRRDRTAMREQNRRLHDTLRERLSLFLDSPERGT
jgi:hypothetical protein